MYILKTKIYRSLSEAFRLLAVTPLILSALLWIGPIYNI